jgi:type II secretory pathway pseudopilin PulG
MNRPATAIGISRRLAFTLVEIIVSLGILVVLLGIISMIISQASRAWRAGNQQMQVAQSARVAFDLLNRDLQGIFVNNQYSPTFSHTALTFYSSVPNPSGAWDICRISYSVQANSLVRFFEYVTAPSSTLTTTISRQIVPNVWSLDATGNAGFTLSYVTANGSFIPYPTPVATTTVPSRIKVELRLADLESLKAGGSPAATPVATYTTTIFIPQSFR